MRKSKEVKIGNIAIGGGNPVAVQSMLNIPASDIEGNVRQALELEKIGCQIIRTAVPNSKSTELITALKTNLHIPVVADIHFDYRLALMCAERGADKIRINPGNIGSNDRIKAVVEKCKEKSIPIRIGVNSGSVEKNILQKYGAPTPAAMVESAMYHVKLLEKFDFDDIVISIKSSNVKDMIAAYRLLAEQCTYPLHLGVTEAGTREMGIIKSAVGIGSLLCDGIGDTIRVSLTDNPVNEIYAGINILKAVGLNQSEPYLVSCPTCGRTQIDLISIASEVEKRLQNVHKPIKVAVMGCVVNGPGEAREADIGIAGGKGEGLIFKKGTIIKKVPESQLIDELFEEIKKL